ncbi:MAG TPA: HAD family hydrolase [Candidatus Polarisedimenticolia bacterium]|nr:HAD family hydrolase [Candidatus Polarisedimenticolia bacterium]
MRRRPHRAVLFDLFDTLCRIDTTTYEEGKRRAARILGVDAELYRQAWIASGNGAQVGLLPDLAARVRAVAASVGGSPDEATVGRIGRLEEECLGLATTLYPDALPALRAVREMAGLKIGLVSNASSIAPMIVASLGLEPFFDHLTFSFRVGLVKPQPGIYLEACRALLVDPEACLFVGDGNGGELDGAKALGMEAVRIERPTAHNPYRKSESVRFDASVDSLIRIPALLRP